MYKMKKMNRELTNGGLLGAVYSCQDIDWMSKEGFVNFLRYFVYFVKPTKYQTVVLILNCQVIHTNNLEAIEMAREVGVATVSLPPQTTHRH